MQMDLLGILEWTAAATSLLSVMLTAFQRIICWPVGIVSVLLYAVFFFEIKLYADAGLQIFFLLTGIYGWIHWARGGANHSQAPIRVLSGRQRLLFGSVLIASAAFVGIFLSNHTDASLPHWDATTSCASVGGQLLLMWKYLDSWYVWLFVDVISVGVYLCKGAYVTSVLYSL
jgi:nicotinamide mononucleotide transporter